MTETYLNSKFVGYIDEPRLFVEKLKEERRKGRPEEANYSGCHRLGKALMVGLERI